MKLALLGYPLTHSLSPALHNAALAEVGLSGWRYEAMPVEAGRLAEAVAIIRGEEYAGANVTVPYKEAVMPYLDGLTPVAEAIGAVNTIIKVHRRDSSPASSPQTVGPEPGGEALIGHNTDAAGLLADLHAHNVSISRRPILILGAGGAARAAVAACRGAYAGAHIRIIARRHTQAQSLLLQFSNSQSPIEFYEWSPLGFLQASDNCALILNATPLGMMPNTGASPWPDGIPFPPDAFVYDLVYNPPETRFIQQARAAGLRAVTGLGMLIEQGALAFEMWTGRPAPRDVMRHAALNSLSNSLISFSNL